MTGPLFLASGIGHTDFFGFDASLLMRVLLLQDYNTRLVVFSTALLGLAAGLVGSFLLLRRRSLMGDALSHATLPGIVAAFLIAQAFGLEGKSLPLLLTGATITGLMGVGVVMAIRSTTRLKDDAAMGIVLSVFFGLGLALLGIAQKLPSGDQAGLQSFIYGKTASMIASDFQLIAASAAGVTFITLLLFKELSLICFDENFAGSQGWPVQRLDALMMVLVAAVTVIGLQAVGLILVVALLIIPAAAARFWTEDLRIMALSAALIGAASGWFGATLSALMANLPAGAVIVLVATGLFMISLVFGIERGVIVRYVRRSTLNRRVGRQHLLRALYELSEEESGNPNATWHQLLAARSWSPKRLNRLIGQARRAGLIRSAITDRIELTDAGARDAARNVRNHRLWEIYLITHADVAPAQVDRDADRIEHVLGESMVDELEQLIEQNSAGVPRSPHQLGGTH